MKYLGKVLQKERLMISIQETLRVGTPRQGMNESCTKSWLPLANVGSSVLHRPRRLYLKRVKLLLSVLKHEFLEVLVISRHGSNSCWKPHAVCHWALGGLCHSGVSNEVLKVPDLVMQTPRLCSWSSPTKQISGGMCFILKEQKWANDGFAGEVLCGSVPTAQHWELLFLGYLPQPGTAVEAALVLQTAVPSENFHIH